MMATQWERIQKQPTYGLLKRMKRMKRMEPKYLNANSFTRSPRTRVTPDQAGKLQQILLNV